ncbi:MAG: M48 family metalloprotease [Anaerolineales bacterium]|jgi:Zn-dependent protease with chaperone function
MNKVRSLFSKYLLLFVIFFSLLAACAPEPAAAPEPYQATRDLEIERELVSQLEKMQPLAVPIYQKATNAMDLGDFETAKDLYEQVAVLAPEFSTTYRRLSQIESQLGNPEAAEELARKAVELEPTAFNQSALAAVLLDKDTPGDLQEAYDLSSAAVAELPDDEYANLILMVSAGATNNLEIAREANERLLEIAPSNPVGHYYAGLLAALDSKWEQAEEELQLSQQLGMPAANVQAALNQGIARNALLLRLLRWSAIALAVWLLGLGVLYVTGTILSRATLRAIDKADPRSVTQVSSGERRIRSIYRAVIVFLSLYFYISIPFVILTLFLVVGGAFYLFFLIGSIPIQLALVLVVMLFVSLYAIVKSLFTRIKYTPPGEKLSREAAPELWRLVENVARKLETRPVDAIYLNPYTGIAVNESGSMLRKLRGGGTRNLMLGMGVLTGMTQGQLAAILAHEYGHFSHQDTAGGDLARLVYTSLDQIAQGLIQARATQIYNPVWLFLMGYQRIFLRVSLGASRLQEVLADRYAALAYGGQNFIEGLRSVIRQGIAFPLRADIQIRAYLDAKQPLSNINNIYGLPMQDKMISDLNQKFDEAMKRATSEYDSHPAPKERIELVERLRIPYSAFEDNPGPALELFPNPERLQNEMTAALMENVRIVTQD